MRSRGSNIGPLQRPDSLSGKNRFSAQATQGTVLGQHKLDNTEESVITTYKGK